MTESGELSQVWGQPGLYSEFITKYCLKKLHLDYDISSDSDIAWRVGEAGVF